MEPKFREHRNDPRLATDVMLRLGTPDGDPVVLPVDIAPTQGQVFRRTPEAAIATEGEQQSLGRGVIKITVASRVPELGLFDLITSASEPLSVDRDVEATDVQQKDQIENDQSERQPESEQPDDHADHKDRNGKHGGKEQALHR